MKFFLTISILAFSINFIHAGHHEDLVMDGQNPFILIARIQVKPDMVDEYLEIADEVDKAVQLSEPGMLFHLSLIHI